MTGRSRWVVVGLELVFMIASVPATAELCPEQMGPWPAGGEANTIAVSGGHAYIGSGAVLLVVDVAVLTEPLVVGHIELPSTVWDVAVSGNHAYVADGGLQIVDVSDPASPTLVGSLELAGNPRRIAASEGYAYLAGNGLWVVDVIDPSSPVEVGHRSSNSSNVAVLENHLFLSTEHGVRVVDVSAPSSPTVAGFLFTDGEVADIAISDDGFGYVAETGSPHGLRVIDLSEPTAPVSVAYWEGHQSQQTLTVSVSGPSAYLLLRNQGVLIFDVENPYSPTFVAQYDARSSPHGLAAARNYLFMVEASGLRIVDADPPGPVELGSFEFLGLAVAVATEEEVAYVANSYMGLRLFDVRDPESPIQLAAIETPGEALDVAVAGGFAYVANDDAGLRVIDVGNPRSPVEVGAVETPGRAVGVVLMGDLALVADDTAGLRVIDISVPSSPVEVGSYQTAGSAVDVEAFGHHALVVDSWEDGSALRKISLSTPSQPIYQADIGWFMQFRARSVTVSGGFAYVLAGYRYAAGAASLSILDLTETGSNATRGSCHFSATTHDVVVGGGFAYVAADYEGLQIIDVSDPSAPEALAFADTLGRAMGVAVSDTTAYVAAHNAGLRIFDMSQPHPIEVGSVDTPGAPRGIDAAGGYAYLNGSAGFRVFDLDNPRSPELVGSVDTGTGGGRTVVSGDLAFVLDGGTLSILDISDPTAPAERGTFSRPSWEFTDVSISGTYVYLAGFDWNYIIENGGLVILDIGDPTAPVEIGFFETPGYLAGVEVKGEAAYAVGGSYDEASQLWNLDMKIIDIGDPMAPAEIGLFQAPADITLGEVVALSDSHAFVGGNGFRVIDISDPTAPFEAGFLPGFATSIEVVGRYVLAAGNSGIRVIDVSDPASPVEVGFGEAPAWILDMAVYGIYLHAACGDAGMQVFDLSECPGYVAPPPTPRHPGGRIAP